MFTGIVEEVGTIKHIVSGNNSGEIAIRASKVLEGTKLGDSISVNGVCLTVTNLQADGFTADVMPETMRRSNLGKLRTGSSVNLERAMAAGGRFGGHIVSGHIDGTGTISQFRREENAIWIYVKAVDSILDLIIPKGSICIDGISLTVAELGEDFFAVSIIPHTGEETTLLRHKVGDVVNLENDVIGKYVQKLMGLKNEETKGESDGVSNHDSQGGLSMDFLREYGF